MILQYLGYAISIILVITAVVCFGRSIYFGYKYTDNFRPTPKSIKANTKYLLLGMLSFFSAGFVFITSMNGFTVDSLLTILMLIVVVSFLIMIGHIINLATTDFLKKRNVPPIFSDEYWKMVKNSMPKPDSDKENK